MRGGFTSGCWAETRAGPAIHHATPRTSTATSGSRTIDNLFTVTSCLALAFVPALHSFTKASPANWILYRVSPFRHKILPRTVIPYRSQVGLTTQCAGCRSKIRKRREKPQQGAGVMAARPTWKGYLKISLVNIPIKVFPATDAGATLSFNQLHAECQTRIQQKRWCPHCEREVPASDIVKGYEFEKGRYVVVGDEDIEKVRVDSTRVINLEKFTDETAIDPIYLERPYYLARDGAVAMEAFAVIREGMKGKAGIGKVALYGREYLVKVQPRERGLIMYTLRHANEIRNMDAIDELATLPEKIKPDEIKLARQVIGTFEGDVDFQSYKDEYQLGLRDIIDAKIEGREIVAEQVEAPPKVVNLMEALRRSLDTISGSKKKPAALDLDARTLSPVGQKKRARA